MRPIFILIVLIGLVPFVTVAKSPYGDLAYALREQQIIGDLKHHCHLPNAVSDEKIRQTFLASKENHDAIIEAAQALKAQHKATYQQHIIQVRCPDKSSFTSQ